MLQLLDRYPLRVEVKGSSVPFVSRRIIITSNASPDEWYPNIRDRTPLMRRITSVTSFPLVDGTPPAWVFAVNVAEGVSQQPEAAPAE